ncbi:tetratricopeptide repeat protein [Micromonospora echinofusca]|uniref:tetratricopeptide repeat protein n=1 Tax=Micromonospora echinofusca TaxID=47858 RepID=UPI0034D737CE
MRWLRRDRVAPAPTDPETPTPGDGPAAPQFLLDQGNLPHTIAYLKQALTDCRRVLGNNHPQTRVVYRNLRAATEGSSSG